MQNFVVDGYRRPWLVHDRVLYRHEFGAGTPFRICDEYRNYHDMRYEANNRILDSDARDEEAHLSAFLIYEDVAAGKRAKESCDVLAQTLGPAWKIDVEMSSFKLLCHKQQRQPAATSASRANLLIFSCQQGDLPREVREWVETCLTRPPRPSALVVLLTGAPSQSGQPLAGEQFLAGVAQRLGMRFFSHLYTMTEGIADDPLTSVI